MRTFVPFSDDLCGDGYRDLVRGMARVATVFGFVIAKTIRADDPCYDVTKLLEPDLMAREKSSSWPGTQKSTLSHVFRYRVTPHSLAVLGDSARCLFDWWERRDRPDDLFFLAADHHPLLTTVTHERIGVVSLTSEEQRLLVGKSRTLREWRPLTSL